MNKLYNDTAVQAIANAIRAKNGSSDTYTIAEMSTALNDLSYYAKPTISNIPLATFEADGLPLNSLKVSIEAQQASGTPSPSNPLPISGWNAVVVSDVDDVDNPTVTQTTTISLGQTVYGGELDVVNGVLNVKWAKPNLSQLSYLRSPSGLFYTESLAGTIKKPLSAATPTGFINSSIFNEIDSASITGPAGTTPSPNGVMALNTTGRLYFNYIDTADIDTFKSDMANVDFIYEPAEPIIIPLTPSLIKSLNGTNNLSVDCGDVIELEYFKEV